eukprot:gnl/MRDRNA2_/MRDRNA2_86559_c2_seq3.p1 gnl/MRDRNA2_/MRDRNA2_86559_c2~~gnl/MRDRNA2_/MRDRNA2_86559_c2_seq3.p1  ORF type:complete len:132 (-),score=24.19 gnl/MRDRNA2_/MRDRNA2_86559_c2_seq3:421-816(-)
MLADCKLTAGVHDHLYARLLELMINQRVGTSGTFEENRQMQRDYVLALFQKLLKTSDNPEVTFVFGGSAVGKSTSLVTQAGLPEGTVHANADDIRSLLVGNYYVYKKLIKASMFSPSDSAAQDCNKIRLAV